MAFAPAYSSVRAPRLARFWRRGARLHNARFWLVRVGNDLIPARIARSGSTTTIDLVADKGSTRLELIRRDDGRMDLVRDGGYRLSLKEAGQ